MPEFFRALEELDIRFSLLTNNSTLTTSQFVAKVRGMGVPATEAEVLTSAEATAAYLARLARPGAGVYVIGETGLREAVRARGFDLEAAEPDYVVVGMDRQLTYEKLRKACIAVAKGAGFIGSNPDVTLPTEEGLIPGCGALLAAIRACTGVEPVVIGKPETRMLDLSMQRMGVRSDVTAMVGDRLDTDIVAGQAAGVMTLLVLTGISTQEEIATCPVKPDQVFADLIALTGSLRAAKASGSRRR